MSTSAGGASDVPSVIRPGPGTHLLPAVMLITVVYQFSGWVPLAAASHLLLLVYVILQWPRLERLPRAVVVMTAVLLPVLPWFSADPQGSLLLALNRAAWFATYLAALSFFKVASDSSTLVRQCGEVIINQPPSKRYITLSAGSLLIGIPLNLAALNLVGVMVRRANTLTAAGGREAVQRVRAERMFSAMARGFSLTPLASPLNLTLALILSILTDLRWWSVLPLGLLTAVMMLAYGWVWDRASAPRSGLAPPGPQQAPPGGLRVILRFLLLVLAIFAGAVAVELALDVSLPLAILLTAPVAAFLWMLVQRRRAGLPRAVALSTARLVRGAPAQFSGLRSEITVLAGAGVMGTLIAAALPTTAIADLLAGAGLHGQIIAILVMLLMVILPQLGLNAMLVATILLSSLAQPELFGMVPEQLALAVMSGWALAVCSSPVSASVLIISRVAGIEAQTLCWGWNGWFTVVGAGLMTLWMLGLGYLVF
ncbi:MAG: hypothetical protein WED00_02580 [Aquisalimonadaceae bacterium]